MDKVLLIGGNGFLGQGLQREFKNRDVICRSIDKDDIDVFDAMNIEELSFLMKAYDNIVILASKLGAQLFETNAKDAATYNKTINDNVIEAIKHSSQRYDKQYSITYYSTSEVFGSQPTIDSYITDKTDYSFDYDNPRHLYSYVKWQAERDLFILKAEHPEMISSVKIIRPFNIFGRNQKRGVVYDMIKSAILEKKIRYRVDTTRTFTDIDFASRQSVDAILEDHDVKVNVVDDRNSLTLYALAKMISKILNVDVEYEELPTDRSIQYRTTSKVDEDFEMSYHLMAPHIIELANQIKDDIQ